MPNTRVYPAFTEEQLNTAVNNAFAAVDPVGLQQDIEYFQAKLSDLFRLPRRFLGFTDEELAANSEYQRAEHRRAERAYERVRNAERYQMQIDRLRELREMEVNIPLPSGRIYYMDFIYGKKEKPLSGGFAFKLKRLNFGLTDVFL
jgi:hypothetical protein